MFNSMRARLTIMFVILTLTPLVIVSVLIAREGRSNLQQQSIDLQEQVVQQTSISLESFFAERENELSVLINVYGLTSLDPQVQRDALLTLLTKQPAYYELTLVNSNGQEAIRLTRGSVVTTNDLRSRKGEPSFQSAIETASINYSPVYFNEDARDRLITISIPIEDLFTGEISHVLIAEVRFQNVEESLLRKLDLTEGEDVYIVDNMGVVIAHRNPNLVLKQTIFRLPKSQGRYTGLTGGDVLMAMDTVQLENLKLTVVAEKTFATATSLASDLTQLATIVTLVSLAISGLVVIFVVSRSVKPITKISRVAQAIQAGDLSARADEQGSREMSTLGRTFNGMTAQLQQTLLGLQDNVRKLEEANEQREKLIKDLQAAKRLAEENSRLKSEFLSTMSHELRTPMNAIEGFTGIMLKHMAGVEYNEKAERYLKKVQSNSQRLLHLINDFLDLSRIESGRLELANLPVSPVEMVKRWEYELGVLAEGKDITFKVSVAPNLPETIYGDEEALTKIARNLLSNAFKFTSEGQVTLNVECHDHQMSIQVADTGIGIPPHAREYIFDEFRQVDQTSRRKYGGTGLGLAIVQKITRAMGGTVNLESELGKGSTFTVAIPIQTEQAQA
ncbi:MAG TPA: ATP-binding protein [Aggregatilineaceae bacterium]|nr:ATP-binding protein [Aggregatilineaceae bacterium]